MVTDNPRIRYWDSSYQEIPYCNQCGIPHPDDGKCLRRNKTQKKESKNLPHPTDMQSSLRDRYAHTVSGVSDGKLVEPEHLPATQEKRRKKKKK